MFDVLDRILPWRSAGEAASGSELFESDRAVDRYAERVADEGLFPAERKAVERYFGAGGSVLDVGCGVGRVARCLAERGYDVTGIDASEPMVARARELAPRVDFRVADVVDTGLPSSRFDHAVFSYFGLDYVHPPRRRRAALGELLRVLRPGGVLVFSSHNTWYALPAALFARDYLRDLYLRRANLPRLFSRCKRQSVPLGDVEIYLTNPVHQRIQLRNVGFRPVAVLGKRDGPARFFEVQPHYVARK